MESMDLSPLRHGSGSEDWKKAHEALKADDVLWGRLAFDGIQSGLGTELHESRRCPVCGSTISRPVTLLTAIEVCNWLEQLLLMSRVGLVNTSARMTAQQRVASPRRKRHQAA